MKTYRLCLLFVTTLLLIACRLQPVTDAGTVSTSGSSQSSENEDALLDVRLPSEGIFDAYSDDPIVPHGERGAWDGQYTDPGAVVYHNGQFHMFHNGFVGWPAQVRFGYSVSDDGYSWQRVQDEPLFDANDLDYVGVTALASSVIVEDDGTWVLYFYSWEQRSWPVSSSRIGRATATDPLGPWTVDSEPVLEPGPEGAWDSLAVRVPSVIRTQDEYIMYYAGYTRDRAMIGRATSEDGVHWVKHDDPATTDELFAESDPVMVPSGDDAWDAEQLFNPRVVQTPDGWVMLYASAKYVSRPSNWHLGYAISQDGIRWRYSEAPIVAASDIKNGSEIYSTDLLYANDVYYLFFEVGVGSINATQVYLATHEGSLARE